ncbi:MAG: HIT family protein [Acidobacteria bacterium]|nr:HIT family protein [Acidobacteriota bacterium]
MVVEPCEFCEVANGRRDAGLVILEDGLVAAFPAPQQRRSNLGHVLIVPKAHRRNLYDLPSDVDRPMLAAARRVAAAITAAFEASGTTLRMNNEPPGQHIFHAHLHVVPRRNDDLTGKEVVLTLDERLQQAERLRAHIVPSPRWPG